MVGRLISLRYSGRCRVCAQSLAPGTRAFHDRETRAVTCETCAAPSIDSTDVLAVTPDAPRWVVGEAGRGAQAEYERRRARHQTRLDEKWGPLAPVARLVAPEPQHVQSFRTGAEGERRLATRLERAVADQGIVLHSRRYPYGDIDHIAVVPAGVFVIDAKNYKGRVEDRDVGGWRKHDRRLYVHNRDRTALVLGVRKQADFVQRAIDRTELDGTPVHAILCFVGAEWGLFTRPITISGVTALWPKRLCREITQPGPLMLAEQERLASVLSAAMPAIR